MSKKKKATRQNPADLKLPLTGADSHAHLDLLADMLTEKSASFEERYNFINAVIDRAKSCGIAHIGQVFLSPEAYFADSDIFADRPEVFFLLGIHPNEAENCTDKNLSVIRQIFADEARLKGVGEIGLDFYRESSPRKVQEEAFRLQLDLARERNLPVIIHSREAAGETLTILENEGFSNRPLLWHCFSGEDAVKLLDRILANGWHISIPGPVTYSANTSLREAVVKIPPQRLLLETDCPYLAPNPWRGEKNEPAYTVFTAKAVAECLGMDMASLWSLCGNNTRRFFALESI